MKNFYDESNSFSENQKKSESDNKLEKLSIEKQIAHYSGFFESDITLRTFIESLPAGIVMINSDGRIIHTNGRISEMFGYSKDELIGEHLNLFIPPNSHAIHDMHLAGYFKQPSIRLMGAGLELILVKKDKTEIPVEISLSYLNSEVGKFGIAFIIDISLRKKAENELKELIKDLNSFAHTVAHDLNSTLNLIIGYSELLLVNRSEITEDKKNKYVSQINESGHKMSKIIHELLLFATLKRDEVKYSTINMDEIVGEAIKRLDYLVMEKKGTIKLPESLLPSIGYAPWIEEVWFNYISNALKYGGMPPIIEIGCEKAENNEVKYWVKDNGKGLMPEDKANIFKSVEEIKSKKTTGLGLGLPIVNRIVSKLKGNVDLESEIGKGSKFIFYLPGE